MPDMLVSLVNLPPIRPVLDSLRDQGIFVRRPNPWDYTAYREFVENTFSRGWADEACIAFNHQPITAFAAFHNEDIIGFAAYECTRRDFFGPTGVLEAFRGRGVGKALLLASLYALQDIGYVYAIIGAAGPVQYYQKTVGAMLIPLGGGRGIYPLQDEPRFMGE